MRFPSRRAIFAPAAALAAALVLAGCAPAASFDPTGPCTVDGQAAGAYPQLESALPSRFRGEPPTRVDSGRSCSDANLATLVGRGVDELRFAGALWETDDRSGLTIARFTAPGLQAGWMAEFYEAGARGGRRTEDIEAGDATVAGRSVWRLDTLNDESFQSVVVWPAAEPDAVWVVLVASAIREVGTRAAHDAVVSDAVAATGP